LVSRDDAGLIDLIAHTFWESLDAIRAFAGDDYRTAVVEQEALVMLLHSDPEVVHRTVVVDGLT
jgi:heme-degrading monooxygenase HmoA